MKTIEEKIAVMQAYAEGKTIECKYILDGGWTLRGEPRWNWCVYDYRIKSEPKYRPYKNADECLADTQKHGGWIKAKYLDVYYAITDMNNSGCKFNARSSIYQDLIFNYVWADDGSVCGVLEEE